MDISDTQMEVEYEVLTQLAEKRWELVKQLQAMDELIGNNSTFWQVGEDGLVDIRI